MSAPNGAQTMKPRTGNTLIVQSLTDYPLRSAIRDHVFAFRRYSANRCFYLNVPAQRPSRLLRRRRYDAIIFDTTFLAARWDPPFFARLCAQLRPLRELADIAVMLPQDEFLHTDLLQAFISDFRIDQVFSVAPEGEWDKIYAGVDRSRVAFRRVLTGYIIHGRPVLDLSGKDHRATLEALMAFEQRYAAPTSDTLRGPKRSASMPAGAPSMKYRKAQREKTSDTCARGAPNSDWKALKNAANEYTTPKPVNISVNAAATMAQP